MPSYSYSTQRDLVIACIAIHNFLRCVSLDDELFWKAEVGEYDGEEDEPSQPGPSYSEIFSPQAQTLMANLRDQIADQLWFILSF